MGIGQIKKRYENIKRSQIEHPKRSQRPPVVAAGQQGANSGPCTAGMQTEALACGCHKEQTYQSLLYAGLIHLLPMSLAAWRNKRPRCAKYHQQKKKIKIKNAIGGQLFSASATKLWQTNGGQHIMN